MKKQRIAVDCDDVIVPTAPLILQNYNETYGTAIEFKDFYSDKLDIWQVPDRATAVKRIEAYLETDEYQQVKPFVDAIAIMQRLSKRYELHVVTGRADFLTAATESMLERYFPSLFTSIEFTNFFRTAGRSKADVCKKLGIDFLVEDHLHHATVVAECGINVLLFGEYPWNQTDQLPAHIQRVKDWYEAADILL